MNLRLLAIAALAVAVVVACIPEYTFYKPENFRQACKDAHTRFYRPPSSPVRSVLWKQEPEQARSVTFHGYVIDGNQRLKWAGTVTDGWQPFLSYHVPVYKPFQQSYKEREAGIPASGFSRDYRNEVGTFIVPASFDVQVTYTIGPESSLNGAGRSMPMAKHSLEVTDLRTGERLAEMIYVIDRARSLACGENIPGQVNMDVFVLQATNLIQNVVQHPKSWVAPKIQYEP
ncbi:MAG TPA: hypothetical protein PLC34_01895 [Burkholderiaceae bacterium]|nr:hypothetical protein [Burkholderiaceae bacterium]